MSDVEKPKAGSNDLIVIGSSAGGVEALSILVSTLVSDFPAPIVIAQHLDPNRTSALDSILQHRTSLPVEVITSSNRMQPGRIYVVPSNRHVSIKDHHVEVHEDRSRRPRPSIDTLLSTAAKSYGERLIAVILTGSGSDGATGAVDVKNAGGTVIVQDPQTARYPSMPLALPPTIVDFEASIEQIGPLLYDLLNGITIPQSEERTEDVLRDILEQVSRQASMDFRPYKTSTILRRVGRRMTVTHNRSMRDYAEYLKTSPGEVGELVNAFLINVTQFFRDAEAFDYLKSDILPKLIARAHDRDRVLRFWTAGCATGEEPYSLAMLLTDLLGAEFPAWSIKIFATDLDEAAINFARRGLYSENLLKGLPNDYRDRFFERVDNGYRISKTLRQIVIFGQQDLSRSAPFPRIDLVLCRNVLIYFTPELQEYVLNQFAFSLSPSGFLFLGKAETVRPMQVFYELVNKHWKVYRCIGNSLLSARRQSLSEISASLVEGHPMNRSRNFGGQHVDQEPSPILEVEQLRRLNELLLRYLPIGIVVIDRFYRILTANGVARRLLGLHDINNEQDFLHAARGIPYQEVRSAIDAVFRERNSLNLPEVELNVSTGGNGHYVSISLSLIQVEDGTSELATLNVFDVTQQVQTRRQLEIAQAEQTQLMNELSMANKRLSDMNKELLDANEEFQVSNEELMLTHEELQASIEEFETTNEELQATNEELETTNDELRARTGELQELMTILENERSRLAEMVELAPFYILLLRGPSLIVDAYNPRYARFLDGRAVQGRPLDEVIDLFWEAGFEIVHLARDAFRRDTIFTTRRMLMHPPHVKEQQGDDRQEAYIAFTIVPSHDAAGRVDGVIIYAVDETEKRQREASAEYERLQLIFDHFSQAALALYDAETGELLIESPRYRENVARMRKLPEYDLRGRKWQDLTLIDSEERSARLWREVVETQQSLRIPELSSRVAPEDPEIIWDYSLTPIMDAEHPQRMRYILLSAIEITEQVQARKDLEQMDTCRDNFLELATQELLGSLTVIQGNIQLLQKALHEQPQNGAQHYENEASLLSRITQQASRMDALIEEMRDMMRIREHAFTLHPQEGINLVELARRVVQTYTSRDREIVLHTNEQDLRATVDVKRTEQVLHNLISNAIKYSPAGNPVVVTVARSTEHAHEAVIAVSDQGPGITPEEQERVFDRFYRTGTRDDADVGLGLGLYIAREIVAQQGGRIWVESQPGSGSTFTFSLPL